MIVKLIKKDIMLMLGYIRRPLYKNINLARFSRIFLVLLGTSLLYFYFKLYFRPIQSVISLFSQTDSVSILWVLNFLSLFVTAITFFLPAALGNLFFSKDIEILQRLPIRLSEILLSKIILSAAGLFGIGVLLQLPIWLNLIQYGTIDLVTVFFGILVLALHAFLISALIYFFSVTLMRIGLFVPHFKKIIQYAGFAIMFFGIFWVEFSFLKNINQWNTDTIRQIAHNPLAVILKPYLTVMDPRAFLTTRVGALLLNGAICIGVGGLSSLLSARHFIKTYRANNEVLVRRHKNSAWQKERIHTSVYWLIKKEMCNIMGTPVFFFNIASMGLLMFVLLGFAILMGYISTEMLETARHMTGQFLDSTAIRISVGLAAGFLIHFICFPLYASTTSLTREGKTLWLTRILPLTATKQILGRVTASVMIAFFSMLPLLILIGWLLKIPFVTMLFLALSFILSSGTASILGLTLDTAHPKTDWATPTSAVKRSRNVMIMSLVFIVILTGGQSLLRQFGKTMSPADITRVLILIEIVYLLIGSGLGLFLKRFWPQKMYEN